MDLKGPRTDATRPREAEPRGEAAKPVAGVPLGRIVPRRLVPPPGLVLLEKERSVAAERFRRLKAILAHDRGSAPQVVVVTSANAGEGKSLVAANLALAFAQDTRGGTLLVDADLRRPARMDWLSPEPALGLSDLVLEGLEPDHAIVELTNAPLHVLPAGRAVDDPVSLFGSPVLATTMTRLRERYWRIVLDTPPVLLFAESDVIAAHADGVLLVARAGRTTVRAYHEALQAITSAPVLGAVLNDVEENLADWSQASPYVAYDEYYKRSRP